MSQTILYYGVEDKLDNPSSYTTQQLFDRTGGNSGNMAFVAGIKRIVPNTLGSVPWGNIAALEKADIAVIPCANQFAPHCDMGREAISVESAKMPFVAIGLGSQAKTLELPVDPTEGTLNWVRAIANSANSSNPNIVVRGHHTFRQLERHGLHQFAVPLGCPSNFVSANGNLGQMIAAKAERIFSGKIGRVSGLAGHASWPHLRAIDTSIANLVAKTKGVFVVQDPLVMYHFARSEFSAINDQQMNRIQDHFFRGKNIPYVQRFARDRARIYFSVSEWMSAYASSDIVIGPRIHGVVLALQAGIPAICVAHDSRTQELCEIMQVPWVATSEVEKGISIDMLPKLFRFDPDRFDANRIHLAGEYIKFLSNNDIVASEHLQFIADFKTASKASPVRGCVDSLRDGKTIGGWGYAPGSPPIVIQVCRGDTIIGSAPADQHRKDLTNWNDGNVGFSVLCSEKISTTDLLSRAVRFFAVNTRNEKFEIFVWSELRKRLQQSN